MTVLLACGDDAGPALAPDPGEPDASAGGDASPQVPPAECGNSAVESMEACDDGNADSGDGCSDGCELEQGWSCGRGGEACVRCGDGEIDPPETCDDGNAEGGDGCSAQCRREDDWQCLSAGEPCELCGNGVLERNERCDEGDFADGVGCSEDCRRVEANFSCPDPGAACLECGNGEVEGEEACDDGNFESGDGCVANCMAVESGWACPAEGGYCALCGDGVLDAQSEECDDGNFQADDGCSDSCRQEQGAVCLQAGVLCSVCGNGFIEFIRVEDNGTVDPSDDFYDESDPEAREACDDGNVEDGDGCSASCTREDGGELPWQCTLAGVSCGRCGDGVVQPIESCDDGADSESGLPVGGDGCSQDCTTVEPGFACPAEGGACAQCGDGVIDAPLEGCDDGNALSGDGCSRRCQLETDLPWLCPEPNQACELCGNGVVEAHESCDDGNRTAEDGCAADCRAEEENYNCYFAGFGCALCGDGELQPGEQCDEGHLSDAGTLTDGCSECQRVEPWACPAAGAPCELCGDGVIGAGDPAAAFETCDDGNTQSSDGCSSQCQVEPGYVCSGTTCAAAACGDGIVATGEECDDGGRQGGDGCSFLCRVEPGFDCSGAAGCRRTRCGDGILEGEEQCDDAGALCAGGILDGQSCVALLDYEACLAEGGSCAAQGGDGCDADCQLESGSACDTPGQTCRLTYCGDGKVEGTEQCDVGGATCVATGDALDGTPCMEAADFLACEAVDPGTSGCDAVDANGCDTGCALVPGFTCEAGESCTGEPASDCCVPTYCGDGVVEGIEACDDGGAVCSGGTLDGMACASGADFDACDAAGGACLSQDGDGCASDCTVETFFRCRHEAGMSSECRPIVEYVSIRRFNVTNINPVGLNYDPMRRSFGGHKSQGSQDSIEMCLDGTVIDQGDATAGIYGTIFSPDGSTSALPPDCDLDPGVEGCYYSPLRPDEIASANVQAMRGASYDPVSGDFLFVHARAGGTLLVQLPPELDRQQSVDINRYAVQLGFDAYGLTVGEDGDLYVVDGTLEVIRVLPRLRDASRNPLPAPDCSAVATPANVNCTSFSPTPDATRQRAAPSVNSLDAIFTLPGERLVSVFNTPDGAQAYDGIDLLDSSTVGNSNYFRIYDTQSLEAPNLSALPGVLFSLGVDGRSYQNAAQAAETAADGGAFIVCTFTSSEDCQIFSRVCEDDSDCPPGTLCNLSGVSSVGVAYCNSPGEARDDVFEVERDVYRVCRSSGAEDGNDCTSDATACLADGGNCDHAGLFDPQLLEVLANDSLSESACVDPQFTILAVCGDGVEQQYEIDHPDSCANEPVPLGEVALEDGVITYDAPDDGSCGFFDTFVYTVGLGGGVIDTAQVRVAVNCECGDGVSDGNEQCDDGAFNGDAGTCVQDCGGDPDSEVLARCSKSCLLNVLCGDGYLVSPEECDDGNIDNGDGCSAVCTRESDCGNGLVEPGEDCDAGRLGSDSCNANCTTPECGDGNLDLQQGEQCDDGNRRAGDGCDGNCHLETSCGNGIVEPGEDCDDGNTTPGDGCGSSCKVENVCGNGLREGSEVCDGSDFGSCPLVGSAQIQCINSASGAPNICLCENYCGDGRIGGVEECDDGLDGSDGCRGATPDEGTPCSEIRCGDGVTDPGETCDDGNTNPADACTNSCEARTSCGNGTVEVPEECDDGNNISGDGCSSTCLDEAASCGDGVVDADEQCDDGNTASGDGCSDNCRLEGTYCGDGTRDVGEECDDGNSASGDGCSASCRRELL